MTAPNRAQRFKKIPQNHEQWQNLYRQNQKEYIRRRLRAIKGLWEGKNRDQICKEIGCGYATLSIWIDIVIEGGLKELVKPRTVNRIQKLSTEQKEEVKRMLLEESPQDWNIDRYIWTGEIICQVVKDRWGEDISNSRMYEILQEIGLSFQRAHRDYANADKKKQKEFVKDVKKRLKTWE